MIRKYMETFAEDLYYYEGEYSMSILVTGPRGFVGARVMDELGPEAVPAPSLRDYREEDILRMVDDLEPEVIIHTAAMSDIPT